MKKSMFLKPPWLNKEISLRDCRNVRTLLSGLNLHTVCEEALCPNISEFFSRNEATFLILGGICTRNCGFCGVTKEKPAAVDTGEPKRVAEAVVRLKLKHVVITSVTRDDLADGGAFAFAQTISEIRKKSKEVTIEVLIPDFQGNTESIKTVVEAEPDVIGHNVETVPHLYKKVRPMADYIQSLSVLRTIKNVSQGKKIFTKSSIMLGLGETEEEVLDVLRDLSNTCCDFLCIGQYLSPSRSHYPVIEYIRPEKFTDYKNIAMAMGFRYVASAPYVRSSYLAREALL